MAKMQIDKKKFPFLARWKQKGFQEFPTFPPELILPYIASFGLDTEYFRRLFREKVSSEYPEFLRTFSKEQLKELEDSWVITAGWLMAYFRMGRAYVNENDIIKNVVIKARDRIPKVGYSKALKHLGRVLLPDTQGRRQTYSTDEPVILKYIYRELQNCIKEIRKALNIYLKRGFESDKWNIEEIKEEIPNIQEIFSDNELHIVTDPKFTPSEASLKIISLRLEKAGRRLTPRAIKNILNAVPPELTPYITP